MSNIYHTVKLGLSTPQIKKLMTGGTVQVHHAKVGRGHTFHLTGIQHRKLRTRHAKGMGFRMHFEPHQIRHHMRHGSGFFDTLKSIGSKLAPVAEALAPIIGKRYKPAVEGYISRSGLPSVVKDIARAGLSKVGEKYGFGRRRYVGVRRRRVRRRGGHSTGGHSVGGSFHPMGGSFRRLGGSFRP